MKMEIPIEAEKAGIAETVHIAVGDFVNEGDVLGDYFISHKGRDKYSDT